MAFGTDECRLDVQIKKAFRRRSLELHPDLCPPAQRGQAETAFKELAEAYAKLSRRKILQTLFYQRHTA